MVCIIRIRYQFLGGLTILLSPVSIIFFINYTRYSKAGGVHDRKSVNYPMEAHNVSTIVISSAQYSTAIYSY